MLLLQELKENAQGVYLLKKNFKWAKTLIKNSFNFLQVSSHPVEIVWTYPTCTIT